MRTIQHSLPNAHKIARHYAKLAVQALYDEVSLYPKPGLVSFIDNGAHQDMNGRLFFKSLFGLRHYFFNVSLQFAEGASPAHLVQYGLDAEKRMNAITGGVNTHRGAIFALGIVCASISKLSMQTNAFSTHDLQRAISNHWGYYLQYSHPAANTHGAIVKQKYHTQDAKQLAINGYAPVFGIFHDLSNWNIQDKLFFGLLAYKQLLICIDDSNVLYRTGPSGLNFAREQIQKVITPDDKEKSIAESIKLHHVFSRKNISPGGVADMLSLIYFFQRVFTGCPS